MVKIVLERCIGQFLNVKRSIRSGFRSLYSIQLKLNAHYPASDNFWKNSLSTIEDVNNFPRQLLNLQPDSETFLTCEQLKHYQSVLGSDKREISLEQLSSAFNGFGSDKSVTGLTPVYQILLGSLPNHANLLEIGIGTNDPKLISSMGRHGKPGASLFAYNKLVGDCNIFGVDIDPNIIFSFGSIKTTVADQTSLQSLMNLPAKFDVDSFDLIIDDGLHSPGANLNSLAFGLKYCAPGALIWIEDIPQRSLEIWWVVKKLVGHNCAFFEIIKVNDNGFGVLVKTNQATGLPL